MYGFGFSIHDRVASLAAMGWRGVTVDVCMAGAGCNCSSGLMSSRFGLAGLGLVDFLWLGAEVWTWGSRFGKIAAAGSGGPRKPIDSRKDNSEISEYV